MDLTHLILCKRRDNDKIIQYSCSESLQPWADIIDELKAEVPSWISTSEKEYCALFWCDKTWAHWAFHIPKPDGEYKAYIPIYLLRRKLFRKLADWSLALEWPSENVDLKDLEDYSIADIIRRDDDNRDNNKFIMREDLLNKFRTLFNEQENFVIYCRNDERDFLKIALERIPIPERHMASFIMAKDILRNSSFKINFASGKTENSSRYESIALDKEYNETDHTNSKTDAFDNTVRLAEELFVLQSGKVDIDLRKELIRVLNHPGGPERLFNLLGIYDFLKHPFLLSTLGHSFFMEHSDDILAGLKDIWPELSINVRKDYFNYLYSQRHITPMKWPDFLSAALFENFIHWAPPADEYRNEKALLITDYLLKNSGVDEASLFLMAHFSKEEQSNFSSLVQEFNIQMNNYKVPARRRLKSLLDIFVSGFGVHSRTFSRGVEEKIYNLLEQTVISIEWYGIQIRNFWEEEILSKEGRASSYFEEILLVTLIKQENLEFYEEKEFFLGRLTRILPNITLEFSTNEIPLNTISLEASLQTPFLPESVFTYNFLRLTENEQKLLLPLLCNQISYSNEVYFPTLQFYIDEADIEALIIMEQNLTEVYSRKLNLENVIISRLPIGKRISKSLKKHIKDILG